MATEGPSSSTCNLAILDSLTDDSIRQIHDSYTGFCATTATLLTGAGDLSVGPEFIAHVHSLCHHGLHSLVRDHFLKSLEEIFEQNGASKFWRHFDAYTNFALLSKNQPPICESEVQEVLCKALEEISLEKQYQEKCLLMLSHALQSYKDQMSEGRHPSDTERSHLFSRYQLLVSSVLMASLPRHFPEILHWYFKGRLEELSIIMGGEFDDDESQDKDEMDLDEKSKISYRTGEMDIDECSHQGRFLENNKLVKNIGKVVRDLRSLGFTSMTEDAYSSAIFLLLKVKVHDLAGDDYRSSVLESIKGWIQAVPLQFFRALLAYLGDSVSYDSPSSGLKSPLASHPSSCYPGIDTPSQGLVRWQLRLEYFAYETLQDLRIAKLFEIIVDYPDSSPAIEDLKQCLEYTGQHSKLVESFISALQYRLLTAGASTNDILHQYVSTIKALRTIDPAGVFLEAVGEPIRDYLRGRKDTIKCRKMNTTNLIQPSWPSTQPQTQTLALYASGTSSCGNFPGHQRCPCPKSKNSIFSVTRCSTKPGIDSNNATNKNPAIERDPSSKSQHLAAPVPNQALTSTCSRGLVLDLGPKNSWDGAEIGSPVVKRYIGDNEERWYINNTSESIGLAVLSNGIHWAREEHVRSSGDAGLVMNCSKNWWAFDTDSLRRSEMVIMSSPMYSAVYWLYSTRYSSEEVNLSGAPNILQNPQRVHGGDKKDENHKIGKIFKSLPGLACSQDGRHWARIEGDHHSGALLDVGSDKEWDSLFIAAPHVVVHSNDDLRMYYHSYDVENGQFALGVARSRDGIRWVKLGKILGGGSKGSFDEIGVKNACVVRSSKEGNYLMAYEGVSADGMRCIGLAVSPDGLKNWTRLQEDPVLKPSKDDGWDNEGVGSPCLIQMEGNVDKWRLYYVGVGCGGRNGIGLAVSEGSNIRNFRRWEDFTCKINV